MPRAFRGPMGSMRSRLQCHPETVTRITRTCIMLWGVLRDTRSSNNPQTQDSLQKKKPENPKPSKSTASMRPPTWPQPTIYPNHPSSPQPPQTGLASPLPPPPLPCPTVATGPGRRWRRPCRCRPEPSDFALSALRAHRVYTGCSDEGLGG